MKVIDNSEIIKSKHMMMFPSDEGFYNVMILLRKKDIEDSQALMKAFGAGDEKLLWWKVVSSKSEFMEAYEFSKEIINRLSLGRMYINLNPKCPRKSLQSLMDLVNNLAKDVISGLSHYPMFKRVSKVSKTSCTVESSNFSRNSASILYDIDNPDSHLDARKQIENFVKFLEFENVKYIRYPTFNGEHIVIRTNGKGYHDMANPLTDDNKIFTKFIQNPWVERKDNALGLVYGVKN